MDVTHIPWGADGWGHLTAVIDCHDREVTGYEFALRGRAKEAERVLEEACLARFGTLRPSVATPVVRSDNGLIFQSRRFRAACRDYRMRQESITPYTPEQNGLVERFFRSLTASPTRGLKSREHYILADGLFGALLSRRITVPSVRLTLISKQAAPMASS